MNPWVGGMLGHIVVEDRVLLDVRANLCLLLGTLLWAGTGLDTSLCLLKAHCGADRLNCLGGVWTK